MTTTLTPRPVGSKGLSKDDISLWGSTAIGLSSTAPVYSLTATLGLMAVAVGTHMPAAFLLAFIPMLFTAFAYKELNTEDPDCGTTFTWASKAFGKFTGCTPPQAAAPPVPPPCRLRPRTVALKPAAARNIAEVPAGWAA